MEVGAVSRLSKAECITFLDALGIHYQPHWTVPELRQLLTDFKKENPSTPKLMSTLAATKKPQLLEAIRSMGISLTGNETSAQALLKVRRFLEQTEPLEDPGCRLLEYGKFKGHSYSEVYLKHPSYIVDTHDIPRGSQRRKPEPSEVLLLDRTAGPGNGRRRRSGKGQGKGTGRKDGEPVRQQSPSSSPRSKEQPYQPGLPDETGATAVGWKVRDPGNLHHSDT